MKFCDNVGDPSYFPTPLPDCLCHVLFSRYSPFSLEVVEKPNKCKKFFGPQFFSGEMSPTFLRQIISAVYRPPFGKVWLSFVCWSPSAKPGNEVKCRIYGGWVEKSPPIWSPLWTKVHVVMKRCRRLLLICSTFARLCISCFIPKI